MALVKCPDCSKPVSDKAEVCLSCGSPIASLMNAVLPDSVNCLTCKKDYPFDDNTCPHCGQFNSKRWKYKKPLEEYVEEKKIAEAPQEASKNGAAAALSFFIPGMGQIYKGKIGEGIAWLFFIVIGYGMFVLPGLILHIACVYKAYNGDKISKA